ncbi:hypothetical protein BZG02_14085 [Labilibaculum filiforme]|uniref:Pyridoxamine 5'-phosphate oxidase N-terminal domain-containing protein n=1 Tax=Labilibaculum filiforme TaxID=1940526 RepID=A0A2N3HVJ1_9BACT|nr:pyridoxamine 5'-phosphate oxidase family protein [Labilibaculum filiforme]PKQ62057.1 hypothetical protein BZG02_14085 [Labilibaculum filiforme]
MKDLIKLLSQHRDLALATVNDQGSPKVRIFQILQLTEQDLYFATAKNKEVYLQLKENPKVEMVSWHDKISIRVAGTAFFDVSDKIQVEIFGEGQSLEEIYQSVDNPNLVFFRVKMEWAELYDLNSNPPHREFFDGADAKSDL